MTKQEPAPNTHPAWLTALKFDADGLIPAIAQDAESNRILMVAWMNRQALMYFIIFVV